MPYLTIIQYLIRHKKILGLLVSITIILSIFSYICYLKSNINSLNSQITELNTIISANKTTISTLTKLNNNKESNLANLNNLLSTCYNSKKQLADNLQQIDKLSSSLPTNTKSNQYEQDHINFINSIFLSIN